MPNSIEKFKKYAPELLDKIYKKESTTSDFDTNDKLVKAGANTNEIIIPILDMDGLADYDRNGGYTAGNIDLKSETKKFNYERGRKLQTDMIDDEETGGVILANVSAEFLRTKVIPEVDAVRYSTYSAIPEISKEEKEYTTGEEVYKAIAKAWDKMTDDEVPESDRHLRITSTLLGLVRDMDSYKSKEILGKFASVKTVPQARFQTVIELNDGTSGGEEKGGFKKGEEACDINFMIIHKPALLQYTKHNKMKVFTPDQDQDGDRYKWNYRLYGLNEYYKNKAAGVYLSSKPKAV